MSRGFGSGVEAFLIARHSGVVGLREFGSGVAGFRRTGVSLRLKCQTEASLTSLSQRLATFPVNLSPL